MLETLKRVQPSLADVVVAGVIALLGQLQIWAPVPGFGANVGPRGVEALGALLPSLALIWRRKSPVAVLATVVTIAVVPSLLYGSSEGLGTFLPILVAFYSVGRYSESRSLVVAGSLTMMATAIHELRDPAFVLDGSTVMYWLILAAAWPVGHALLAWERRYRSLSEGSAAEYEEQRRLAVAAERARLARELHDVVGHSLSIIAVQAGAASGVMAKSGEASELNRVRTIEEMARQTLSEMRRLVDLLDPKDAPLSPQADLCSIDSLLGQVQAAGLQLDFAVEGNPCSLSPGLNLTVYRVIQESLTNVLKHAGSNVRAQVRIKYFPDSVDVEILDNGLTRRGRVRKHGRGLIGMRERVLLYGGMFAAGPSPDGGFHVHAHLPLQDSVR